MATGSTNANTLIQEQVASFLVQPLEKASVILNAGATLFDSSEPLRIPTIAERFNPAWVGENELIPEDEVTTGEIKLMPTNHKSIKVITRVSNELIRMATVSVSSVLEQRIVSDVRLKLDDALLSGDGLDNSITGLLKQPGVTTGTFDATKPDTIIDERGTAGVHDTVETGVPAFGEGIFCIFCSTLHSLLHIEQSLGQICDIL